MQELQQGKKQIPRFSVISGIGGICVYMLSSIPVVGIITIVEYFNLQNEHPEYSASKLASEITNYLSNPWVLSAALITQCLSLFFYAYIVSVIRGTANPFNDFGMKFTWTCLPFYLAGFAMQFVGLAISIPLALLYGDNAPEQQLITSAKDSAGMGFILFALLASFLVPIAEELCFRGMFMRGLSKKVRPMMSILITGSLFAAIHLSDPNTFIGIPILIIVGLVTSALAMYRGKIDGSILFHMGFNSATMLLILLAK